MHGGNGECNRLTINMKVGAENADCALIGVVESTCYFACSANLQMQDYVDSGAIANIANANSNAMDPVPNRITSLSDLVSFVAIMIK